MITPTGVITEFTAGISPGATLGQITLGPDGNLWFTEPDSFSRIGKVTLSQTGQAPIVPVFVVGFDDQVYAQKFDASGASSSPYVLTRPGAVKTIEVGQDAAGDALLFAIGGDNQVYLQKFDAGGNSASPYTLVGAGGV